MRFHPIPFRVMDWSDHEVVLERAEDRLHHGEANVVFPQMLRSALGEIGPEEIDPFRLAHRLLDLLLDLPPERCGRSLLGLQDLHLDPLPQAGVALLQATQPLVDLLCPSGNWGSLAASVRLAPGYPEPAAFPSRTSRMN